MWCCQCVKVWVILQFHKHTNHVNASVQLHRLWEWYVPEKKYYLSLEHFCLLSGRTNLNACPKPYRGIKQIDSVRVCGHVVPKLHNSLHFFLTLRWSIVIFGSPSITKITLSLTHVAFLIFSFLSKSLCKVYVKSAGTSSWKRFKSMRTYVIAKRILNRYPATGPCMGQSRTERAC